MLERLHRFDTEEVCWRWNAVLHGSFSSDAKFFSAMDALNAHAAMHCGHCIVSDGLQLATVRIVHEQSLTVDLRINSLTGPGGFSSAPSRFTVAWDHNSEGCAVAHFGCGICGTNGNFWYPRSLKRAAQWVPEDYTDWAYHCDKHYNGSTISSWIAGPSKRG